MYGVSVYDNVLCINVWQQGKQIMIIIILRCACTPKPEKCIHDDFKELYSYLHGEKIPHATKVKKVLSFLGDL